MPSLLPVKTLSIALLVCLLGLQYRLWVGEGSYAHVVNLKKEVTEQSEHKLALTQRNDALRAEVTALKDGLDEIEARAREDLGMIKDDETFYLMLEDAGKR